ncbi:beta-carotene 15,15'-monooxygenase [Halobacteriales archaeon QS_9_67_17]|nr:MAG: beta-carotene 15,15'-monooxygenase [Halobacteriales archaeon QS_9_67_17]
MARSEDSGPDDRLGFHSLSTETTVALPVEGSLPEWLSGSLVRNGPGSFSVGDGSVDHWFDGLAMLTRFTFDDGVRYSNRFLRTDAYEAARAGRFDGGFATGESTLRERLWNAFRGDPYDNTNIILERIGDEYLALTESPRWVRVDPTSLETLGHRRYDGPAPSGDLACAHLRYDPDRDLHVNVETEFGRPSYYHVYAMRSPERRKLLASVPTDRPSYMHSFALTPDYVVLTAFPFDVNPLAFFKPGRQGPFVENFRWRPDAGTTVYVINRHGGGVVGEATAPPVFGFHHVNAYQTDGDVVFDLETLPDADAVDSLDLAALRAGQLDAVAGRLDRYRVTDPAGEPTVERTARFATGTGLPTVSPATRLHEHRYVYAQGTDTPVTRWPRAVRKVDTVTGRVTEWSDDTPVSEPIFVPRSGSARPTDDERAHSADDGVVLTVTLDHEAGRSTLVVLDGETLTERARAPLPHALPFDFHGRFFPELVP